jgi:hypothetical protein
MAAPAHAGRKKEDAHHGLNRGRSGSLGPCPLPTSPLTSGDEVRLRRSVRRLLSSRGVAGAAEDATDMRL